MPKPQKLHPRGRAVPASLQKPDGAGAAESGADESTRSFELELCWCIQQLERALNDKKLSEKHLQESWKVLTVLKNNNQPIIRKRQLMRTHFGDYRAKMAQEEKKLAKMASAIKITESPANPKATFIRRSAFLTTGDSSFRFNFDLAPDQQVDGPSEVVPEEAVTRNSEDKTNANSPSTNKAFKFSFTNSPFKFNFKS